MTEETVYNPILWRSRDTVLDTEAADWRLLRHGILVVDLARYECCFRAMVCDNTMKVNWKRVKQ